MSSKLTDTDTSCIIDEELLEAEATLITFDILLKGIIDEANEAFDGKGSKLWVKPKNKTIEEVKEQIREEDREATKES